MHNYKNETWNLADDFPTTREVFLLEVTKIKKSKNFSIIPFNKYKINLSDRAKKFWVNNKRVSNLKVKKYFEYRFIFPNYRDGIKSLKEYF